MRNFTKKVASLCGLVKKVKEVKVFGKLLLLSIFLRRLLFTVLRTPKSPNSSLTSLIVRKFKMNGIMTPNYILTFSEETGLETSLREKFLH